MATGAVRALVGTGTKVVMGVGKVVEVGDEVVDA